MLCSKEGRGTTSTPEDTGAKRRRAGASAGLIALVCLGLAPLVHAQVPDFDRNGVADEADLVYFIRQYAQRAGNWDRNVDLKQDSILNHEDALRMIDALLQAGSAEAIQLAATLRATGEKFLEIGQASPRDPDLQGFAAWLRARDDVAQAEVQGGGVAATTKTGVNLLFTVRPTGALGIPSVAPVSDTASCLLAFASSGQVRPADITCLGELVPRGEALLIDVVHDDPCAFIPDVREMLRRAGYTCMEKPPGLPSFGYMKDAELTVVKSHGGVWQDSRGADHFWFFATYTFLEQPIPDLSPYLRELRDGSLLVGYSLEVNQQTNQVEGATRFVGIVADKWFPRYVGAVPRNAAVFFIMCDSAALDEPARTFFGMGAQAYFGFTHTVRNNWGTAWLKKYLDRLTGSNTTDEWDRPPRRPQNFRDAFDYVRSHTGYSVDSAWGARAKLSLADNPESKFALSPYIGYAFLEWTLENHNNLFLSGAFGCRPSVYIDSSALPVFYAGAGGGQPVGVRIARDTAGEVWVKAEDGRATNRVVVSQLQADIRMNVDQYAAIPCTGTVRVHYTDQVVAHRLYNTITGRLRFGGWDERLTNPPSLPYPLCTGQGDWHVDWSFNSTRTVGNVTYKVIGSGQATGRGTSEDGPSVLFTVELSPAESAPSAQTCSQKISVGATVGPLRVIVSGPGGTTETQQNFTLVGTPFQEGIYDQVAGRLRATDGTLVTGGTWHMDAVQLTPPPPGLDHVALGPEPWARGLELARLWPPRSRGWMCP